MRDCKFPISNFRRRAVGQALLPALLTLLLVVGLVGLFVHQLLRHLDVAPAAQQRLTARTIAEAGLDFAVQQLDRGHWLNQPRPFSFTGSFAGGTYQGNVQDVPGAAVLGVTCMGREPEAGRWRTLRAYVTDPTPWLQAIRSVFHPVPARDDPLRQGYRFTTDEAFQPTAQIRPQTVCFGSDGVAVNALACELRLIPEAATLTVFRVSDPTFAGLIPGRIVVLGGDGRPFEPDLVSTGQLQPGT